MSGELANAAEICQDRFKKRYRTAFLGVASHCKNLDAEGHQGHGSAKADIPVATIYIRLPGRSVGELRTARTGLLDEEKNGIQRANRQGERPRVGFDD